MSDAQAHFTEAWRAVAVAKIDEFAFQCEHLATLARGWIVNRSDAADVLHQIAEANSLDTTFGAEFISNIIADAFQGPAARTMDAAE